jgi:transposase
VGAPVCRDGGRPGFRVRDPRRHHRARAPAWGGREGGAAAQAIGRSRGGWSTKLHVAVDALGNPLRLRLSEGQRNEITQAAALIEGLPATWLIADAAFDAGHFREALEAEGIAPVIPSNPSRAGALPYDRHLYKERHLVECFFSKIKQFRRVATRYEKTATNFLAIITLASTMVWLR